MSRRDSLSSDEKSGDISATSSRPPDASGDTAPSSKAGTRVIAATVFTPFNRSFVVDQDAQYPNCTYKES